MIAGSIKITLGILHYSESSCGEEEEEDEVFKDGGFSLTVLRLFLLLEPGISPPAISRL